MTDVSIDQTVLQVASTDILRAARELLTMGAPRSLQGSAVGSDVVEAVLAQVGVEQAARAEIVAEMLLSQGWAPAAAAQEFAGMDRSMAGAR